ncbi:MAG: DUF4395 domain-containing protein [Actinomycetota bacterium]|nr:DUF4395 domain-containing protein [Actinomycetota bacterium]
MVDSAIPRFSQAVQAVALAVAYAVDARALVPLLTLVLLLAVLGGPNWNLFGRIYRGLRLPAGEPEPAAPPRFAQTLGAVFLAIATAGLFLAERDTTVYSFIGWGPALAVAVLAGLAATTNF